MRLVLIFQRAVGSFGLAGLDRLLCFMIVKELQTLLNLMRRIIINPKDKSIYDLLNGFSKTLNPIKGLIGKLIYLMK